VRATRDISIIILMALIGCVAIAAEDGPDASELERRKALEHLLNAKPAPNPMPEKLYTPEQSASPEHRAIVSYEPGTKTLTVLPARESAGPAEFRPFVGLFGAGSGPPSLEVEPGDRVAYPDPIYPLANATEFPYRTVVKLVIDFPHPNPELRWSCSGAMVDQFHVITAGHCVYTWDLNDDDIDGDRAWADEILVLPAQGDVVDPFNDPSDEDSEADWPFGVARSVLYRSYSGWTESHNHDHDWAVITLNRREGLHTGWMGIETGNEVDVLNFTGYPAEEDYGFGDEIVQWYGWGWIEDYADYHIDMEAYSYGGHSGGPSWRFQNGAQWIQGVASTSDRQGFRRDTRVSSRKLGDLQSYIADDWTWRPPVDRPDLQECLFPSWGCYKDLQTNVVAQGGAIRVVYNVLNSGFANSGNIDVSFYLSANDHFDPWDILIFTGSLAGLDSFDAYNSPVDLIVPAFVPPGEYYVGWTVASSVPEYDTWPIDNNAIFITDETLTVEPVHAATVTVPNGGEIWYEGNTGTINWGSLGGGDYVSIELSRNGGASYEVLEYVTDNDGSYTWTVTGPPSENCLVRITPTSYPGSGDVSDASFSIRPALLQMYVTSPNGGENWFTGYPFDITWNSFLAGPSVSIEITRDSGISWQTIAPNTANDGLFTWYVTGPVSNNCLIRVTSLSAPAATDASNGYFSISSLASSLALQEPNGGEVLAVGRPLDIRWTSVFLYENVKIELSRNGGFLWETLTSSTPNDGLFTWNITGPTTTNGRIRISAVNTTVLTDMSDSNFSILYSLASIDVASPNGGEDAYPGYPLDITWNTAHVTSNVKIELSRNAGVSWDTITASTSNDGLFTWPVTGPASSSCLIRISSVADPTLSDVSDGYFNIVYLLSNLLLTSPNGGEVMNTAALFDITWDSSFLSGEIGIDISRDGGGTWETIISNTPNDGLFSWVVTGAMSEDCLMRIRSIDFPVLSDTSNGTFAISSLTPRLQIDDPNGGEEWHMDVAYVLRWSSALVTSQVAFDASRDGGLTWETIIDATTNDGLQIWYPTGPESATSRIRIRALDDPSVNDTSDADFSISPLYDVRIQEVRKMGGGQIELRWTDTDWEELYGVYRGTLTAPFSYNHDTILACDLVSGTTQWMTPDDQATGQPSYYYLVVPQFQNTYQFGQDSDGDRRPPSATVCP
jgi:V8-like Glu-specific endopeptidase